MSEPAAPQPPERPPPVQDGWEPPPPLKSFFKAYGIIFGAVLLIPLLFVLIMKLLH